MMEEAIHPGQETTRATENRTAFFGLNKTTFFVFLGILSATALFLSIWLSSPLDNWWKITLLIGFDVGAFLFLRNVTDPGDPRFYKREFMMLRSAGTAATLSINFNRKSISPALRTMAVELTNAQQNRK